MRLILFFSGTSILTGCIDSYPTSPNKKFVDLPSEDFDGDLYSENDGDLDDNDPTVYPNAEELCDGKDNDCDTTIDNTGTVALLHPTNDPVDHTSGFTGSTNDQELLLYLEMENYTYVMEPTI